MNRPTFVRSQTSAVAPMPGWGSGFPIVAGPRCGLFKEFARAIWPASREQHGNSRSQSAIQLTPVAPGVLPAPAAGFACGRPRPPGRPHPLFATADHRRNGHRRLPRVVIQNDFTAAEHALEARASRLDKGDQGPRHDAGAERFVIGARLGADIFPVLVDAAEGAGEPRGRARSAWREQRAMSRSSKIPSHHNRQSSRAASRRRASHNMIRNTARPRYQRSACPNASRLAPYRPRKTIKRAHGFAQYSGGHRPWNGQGQARSNGSPVSPLAAHRRQTRPASFVVARSVQVEFQRQKERDHTMMPRQTKSGGF